jgi:hypothetical protein
MAEEGAVFLHDAFEVLCLAKRLYHRVSRARILAVGVSPQTFKLVQVTLLVCLLGEVCHRAILERTGYEVLLGGTLQAPHLVSKPHLYS